MPSTAQDRSWADRLNISDSYSRGARLRPAVLSIMVALPSSCAFGGPLVGWIEALLAGAGVSAVVGAALSQFASFAGNRFQAKLWPRWPHDSPTNRCLHPHDATCSQQQKRIWYGTIKHLTGLDIGSAIKKGDVSEIERVINDAVARIRNLLSGHAVAKRLDRHNMEYGFARNLAGLRPIWFSAATASGIACCVGACLDIRLLLWAVVASIVWLICICLAMTIRLTVQQRANRYAESFFAALARLNELGTHPAPT